MTLCIVLVLTEVTARLCSEDTMIYFLRSLIMVAFIISLISSYLNFDFLPDIRAEELYFDSELTEYVNEQYDIAAQSEIERSVKELLLTIGESPKKIEAYTDISEEKGIELRELHIDCSYDESAVRVRALLEKVVGEETNLEVTVNGR